MKYSSLLIHPFVSLRYSGGFAGDIKEMIDFRRA